VTVSRRKTRVPRPGTPIHGTKEAGMSIPVTIGFDPTSHAFTIPETVTAPPGTDRLVFRRDGHHPGWTFFGIAIWPQNAPEPTQPGDVCAPFNDPPPQVQAHSMVVVDNNPGGTDATFGYRVWVTDSSDNQRYSSDPQILNKGG
jgi:hypothetical protein